MKAWRGFLVWLTCTSVFVAAFAPTMAWACAGCRNPNLPQTRAQSGPVPAGGISLGVAGSGTWLNVAHPAGCADVLDCDETVVQPLHSHDLFLAPAELRFLAGYTFSQQLALELELPVRMVATQVEYFRLDSHKHDEPFVPEDVGIHHRNETLFGIGDVQIRLRFFRPVGRWWLTARGGFSLPTGRTQPDPFALGDRGERHQHIQFGSGTLDPAVSVDLTRSANRSEWSFYSQSQLSFYENVHGFRAPVRGLVGLAGGVKISPNLILSMGVEGAFEGPERWQGVVRSDASLGRYELLTGPQILWAVGSTTLTAMSRFPLVRHIVAGSEEAGTLRSPVVLGLGAFWTFDTN